MNSVEESSYLSPQGTTTPVAVTPASKDTVDRLHSEKVKMNATPNGYSSVPNHKTKLDSHGMPKKHDSSKSNDHHKHSSDSSKHNSDHAKRKDGDSHKHASKQSSNSHSKSKDSSVSKDGSTKVHSSKSNDISKPKEHNHDKEKKHSSSIIKNRESSGKHSESSKHGIVKKESEKGKSDDKGSVKKEKSSHEKSKSDNFKENDKAKEKLKEGKMHEHKDKLKEKSKEHDKHKDKSKEHDKHRDKSKEHDKSKEKIKKTEDHKDKTSDKPKEKSGDKLKEKSFDKQKEKSFDKPKDKTLEKPIKEKTKVKHRDSSSEKHSSDHLKKPAVEGESHKAKSLSPIKIKVEAASPKKIKEDPLSDDDVPLSARKPVKDVKPKVAKRVKEELEDDDEPLSSRIDKVKKIKTENSSSKKRKIESDDEEYESDYGKPAKKVKKAPPKKQKVKNEPDAPSPTKKRGKKEEEQEVWKWWEEEKLEDGCKWRTLEHNGPVFAPLYERVPKSVKFYYDGKHMALSEVTEEVAGFYGRMLDHEYTTKDSFNTNFFKDWRKVMIPSEKEIIKDLSKCNFNDFDKYYKLKSEERKSMTKDQKNEIKKQNEEMTQKYGFCVIDGHRQKIGNFRIEPPGLFRGRGEHPKMGMLKRRVQPEDILINIGKQAPIPEPPAGHKWKEVRHDNAVTWLASWNENILNSTKYIMLNPSSKLKGEKDWQKYETARKLKNHAGRIRKTYEADFKSKEMRVRQRAVALYFIDKLALRAGNEKDEETADTVGCCSLRVEHITLDDEKDGQEYVVSFDFLGKDSIRYENSVAVEKRAYKNLKLFMDNKQPGDDLFDRLNTGILNKYLNELMEGLTAKVFRTYNASKTLQEQLDLLTKDEMSIPEKVLAYNRANRAVALLCNHQRSVPKGFSKSMENLKGKLDDKLAQIKDCKRELKSLKSDQKNSGSMKDKVLYEKKKKRLQTLEEQFQKLEVQATDKEENKQIALGTSKLNYLDPRISVAWCKKWNVPIEKVYNRTQRDKFRWAIEMAGPEFTF